MGNTKVIIIRGPPGSGKSTASRLLGEKIGGKSVVFNKDSFIIGMNFFNVDASNIRNDLVNFIIVNSIKKGCNVVVDGFFAGKDGARKLENIKMLARKNKSKFFVFNLHCSLKTTFKRVLTRKGHIVPSPFPKKEIIKWYNHFYQASYKNGIDIDTERISLNETIKFMITKINEDEK